MDKEQEYNPDLITVQDDEGNEHIFEELDRIETDQGRYVAMLPTFDSEEEMLESDSELIIRPSTAKRRCSNPTPSSSS